MGDLAILVVTSPAYQSLAELTGRLLDRHWVGHPPVFFCGGEAPATEGWLPLRDDPRDWMGIVRRAVGELRAQGLERGYVVLEDHPPLFRCHAPHLNRTIPGLMDRLGAAVIGLHGWGQGKPRRGTILGPDAGRLERLAPDFLWKFQLHPALWRLPALLAILAGLIAELPLERRSPWAFERQAGRADAAIPEALKRQAYRICGARMTASHGRRRVVGTEQLATSALRALTGRLAGPVAGQRVEHALGFLLGYYEGPYPIFRSGVLVKGRPNPALLRFLRFHGQQSLAAELARSVDAGAPVPAGR